jgi:Tol biopolymer transport system component
VTRLHRVAALTVALAIGPAACSDKGPLAPTNSASPHPPSGVVVSNAQVSATPVAYASAAPGTFPGAGSAAVRNRTRNGVSQFVELIEGGFDPVAIEAAAGDELSLTVFMTSGGSTTFAADVPLRRLPGVVRTNLSKDLIDVTLNVLILVVFSEPVDKSTVTSSSVALSQDGSAVEGSVHVSADGLTAEFTPDGRLQPHTAYSLMISEGIRDLDGDGIGQTSSVTFATAGVGTTAEETGATGLLLFASLSDGQIYRIGIGGTGLTRLTSSGRNSRPVWSPDGLRIAFGTHVPGQDGDNGTNDIYTMDADGSNVVRRTNSGNFSSAAWSPDGRKLAVSTEAIYWSEIYLISADEDGSNPIHLATAGRSPTWSPDGKSIAFVHVSGDDGYDHISVMNGDGTGIRPLTEIDPGGIYGLGWSPDGQRLAFSKCLSASCDLYVINADGSELRRITHLGNAQGASWSPDGKWIAFTLSNYSGASWLPMIAYVAAEGGTARVVAQGYWPSWGNDSPATELLAAPAFGPAQRFLSSARSRPRH